MDKAPFDEIADWYDEAIKSGPQSLVHDLVVPAVFDLVGNIEGQKICDLACGQGVIARQLTEQGAEVVGVDLSEKLLDIARRYEQEKPRRIHYKLGDAQVLYNFADASFDGVVCNLALMDIPDLDACLSTVRRILRPGGWFVFSITHPCFQTLTSRWIEDEDRTIIRGVRDYFVEGFWRSDYPEGVRGKVGSHHRTMSTYVNTLVRAGLIVERFAEPRAAGRLAERVPGYREVPPLLIARCTKPVG